MLTQSERNYLVYSMAELLEDYDYEYTYDALYSIVDEWASQKEVLIEAFKKHPNYVEGKFMIAFDADFERAIDRRASTQFGNWILSTAVVDTIGMEHPKAILEGKMAWHHWLPYDVFAFFNNLNRFAERCVSEEAVSYINSIFTELKAHPGQKTSRVINKICQYLGFDKVDGYNREYAKYADSLSPLTIKRHTILSINPLDYLTMSFGNSWASCHTIDKENRRKMPNNYSGCYSSGTISYMLDGSSMVLYTVDASYDGNEYWSQDKINRQMFHWGEEKLVQARLYPQDNDGCGDAYTPYRNIVQGIMSTIFEFPNLWTLKKGTEEASRYIKSYGTNYKDYYHYSNCNLSRIKGSENENKFVVGESPICIECGDRHSVERNINCCRDGYHCADCGCTIDEDDVIWVNDEPYCRDCVEYCDYCEEYHRSESTYVEGFGYVCEDCLEHHFYYCDDCDSWHREDSVYYIDCEDRYVCENCLHDNYRCCENCCEYFPMEDMNEYDGEWYCEECYDEIVSENEDEDDEVC